MNNGNGRGLDEMWLHIGAEIDRARKRRSVAERTAVACATAFSR